MPTLGALTSLDLVLDDGLAVSAVPQISVRHADDDGCWLFRTTSSRQVGLLTVELAHVLDASPPGAECSTDLGVPPASGRDGGARLPSDEAADERGTRLSREATSCTRYVQGLRREGTSAEIDRLVGDLRSGQGGAVRPGGGATIWAITI